MGIEEMHILFRQLAQQMGLQNVRGILPEQIDLLLNTSILDILKQIIQTNVGLTSPNGVTTNSKIGQINSLRNLYTTSSITLNSDNSGANIYKTTDKANDNIYLIDNLEVRYKKSNENIPYTDYFDVRLIDKSLFNRTNSDPILKPTVKSPIGYYSVDAIFVKVCLEQGLDIYDWRISYIKKPATVSITTSVDCDIHESFHNDVVRNAVSLYLTSIGVGQSSERSENNK